MCRVCLYRGTPGFLGYPYVMSPLYTGTFIYRGIYRRCAIYIYKRTHIQGYSSIAGAQYKRAPILYGHPYTGVPFFTGTTILRTPDIGLPRIQRYPYIGDPLYKGTPIQEYPHIATESSIRANLCRESTI